MPEKSHKIVLCAVSQEPFAPIGIVDGDKQTAGKRLAKLLDESGVPPLCRAVYNDGETGIMNHHAIALFVAHQAMLGDSVVTVLCGESSQEILAAQNSGYNEGVMQIMIMAHATWS